MNSDTLKSSEYSVAVIGSGIAGLYTALKLSKKITPEQNILLITKSPLGESNSRYAQGGIAAVINKNTNDNIDLHVKDTLHAGAGLSEKEVVEHISKTSEDVINDLISIGIVFDKYKNGDFTYTLAGAHSAKRVLHCLNDATGRCFIDTLINAVKNTKNIHIAEKSMAVELLITENKECAGVITYNKSDNSHEVVFAENTIIASGGIGQIYKFTTNPYGATGDGIALAYEAGAVLQDMEFIQFHPTSLVINPNNRNRFLISEAVRGEGAKLVNHTNEKFMQKYSDKQDLAPRDVVTRAIISEMHKENSYNVYLDISEIKNFDERFPHIARKCETNGIEISKNLIPVAPAAHYLMGGVKADINGQTSIKGLYVVGESASIGFHGANRLACNSLLECVVSPYELAKNLTCQKFNNLKTFDKNIQNIISNYAEVIQDEPYNEKDLKDKLRDIMWNNVGIIRTEKSLLDAKIEIENLNKSFRQKRKCLTQGEYELRNMITIARVITESAISRKESRGAHFCKDYPQTNPHPQHSEISRQ